MSGIYPELEKRGFRILEGAINEDGDPVKFASEFGAHWPVGMASSPGARDYLQLPSTERAFVPFMVFIDRQGMIRAQYTGSDQEFFGANQAANIKAEVEKLLAEPAPAPAKGKSRPSRHQ